MKLLGRINSIVFLLGATICLPVESWAGGCNAEIDDYMSGENNTLTGACLNGLAAFGKGDYQEAIGLFETTANDNDPISQFYLGYMYWTGKGTPQNYVKALDWFLKSADQGYGPALRALGVVYWKGTGVPKDQVTSYFWLSLAAAIDHGSLEYFDEFTSLDNEAFRDIVSKGLTPEQVLNAQMLATGWAQQRHLQ